MFERNLRTFYPIEKPMWNVLSPVNVEIVTMVNNKMRIPAQPATHSGIKPITVPVNTPVNDAVVAATASQAQTPTSKYGKSVNILRQVIGGELRRLRLEQGRTLREVSGSAQVSLGYLSEVERGQKEPSSELLNSICGALDTPLSHLLANVTMEVAKQEVANKPMSTTGISKKSVTVAA